MKYSFQLAMAVLLTVASSIVGASNNTHDYSVTGSVGTIRGEIDGVAPETSLEFNAAFDYFTSPYTYILFETSHSYLALPTGADASQSTTLTSFGVGTGREVPVSDFAGFYLEGIAGFGYGTR